MTKEAREHFVQLVFEKKEGLFRKFSNHNLTSDDIKQNWEWVRNELVSAGAVEYSKKTTDDMRRTFADMKRRTMQRKRQSETSENGGKVRLRRIDQIILDIVGHHSPASVFGLGILGAEKVDQNGTASAVQPKRRRMSDFSDGDEDFEDNKEFLQANMASLDSTASSSSQAESQSKEYNDNVEGAGFPHPPETELDPLDLQFQINKAKLEMYQSQTRLNHEQAELCRQRRMESSARTKLLEMLCEAPNE